MKMNKNEFDAITVLSVEAKQEQEWRVNNGENLEKRIPVPSIRIGYYFDSSSFSWGTHFGHHKIWGGGLG